MASWWKDVVAAMPTVQAIRSLARPQQQRGAKALLLLLGFYAVIALATPHWAWIQHRLLESSHYRPRSLASWVVLQPAPKMYGFANRVWRGPSPRWVARAGNIDVDRFAATSFWVNHYPARMARYDGERARVFERPGRTVYVLMHSHYRDADLWSMLEVREQDAALQLKAVEVAP